MLYPYNPQHDDELQLQVGQKLTKVVRLEMGWYRGVLNGIEGVFPDNFVKVSVIKISSFFHEPSLSGCFLKILLR